MIQRLYESLIAEHFSKHRQMAFLAGPRQVGKTTIAKWAQSLVQAFYYLNWDNTDHQRLILSGPAKVAEFLGLTTLKNQPSLVVFDELHKYSRWKQFLKGFFDTYGDQIKIIVTGSNKFDIYKRIGDSLMGRYLLYRVHPVSTAEYISAKLSPTEIKQPKELAKNQFDNLFKFGGFPEPLLKADERFERQWQQLRYQQTFHDDIRGLTHIHEIAQLELLAQLIKNYSGQLINYSQLALEVNVSVPTIKRWLTSLSSFYYCFAIKPWHKNVSRSLLKQPKIYLWDWSLISEPGARFENFIAAHLLKAINYWHDCGFGQFELYFLRDKEQREVDFLVTKNNKPWFIIEAKNSHKTALSSALYYFQELLNIPHAFQVALDLPYINKDCFEHKKPIIVPAITFLSQLI